MYAHLGEDPLGGSPWGLDPITLVPAQHEVLGLAAADEGDAPVAADLGGRRACAAAGVGRELRERLRARVVREDLWDPEVQTRARQVGCSSPLRNASSHTGSRA